MMPLTPEQVDQLRQLTNYKDKFDAIIAFGYGPVESGSQPKFCRLNTYGRINAIATGMLYQSCHIGRIIPTGGKTGGLDKPSEAQLIAHIIQSKFDIPESVFTLEEQAVDTIFNIVHVANIIDQSPQLYQNLLFVAMGFHLPRIQKICSFVGLDGSFIAAESVVKIRSERHKRLLLKLLNPENTSYAKLLTDQERGIRGLREIPEYWIPPLGVLSNTYRLLKILESKPIFSFLSRYQIDINSEPIEDLRIKIGAIPRKYPDFTR